MRFRTLSVGMLEANCHVLWDDERRALVVDPGAEPEVILEFLNESGLTPAAYLLTHGHVDHISAAAALHRRFPAPVEIHAADAEWAFCASNHLLPIYPPPEAPPGAAINVEDGQVLLEGGIQHRVLFTPGHSPGGVCFYFEAAGIVCTGDTLFRGTVGRTDFPGGNSRTLQKSLAKLKLLPPDTRILAGHGPESTIGHELENNMFMRPGHGGAGWV